MIDYWAFPHIVEQIITSVPPRDRFPLRLTSRKVRDYVDSMRQDHIVACSGGYDDCVARYYFEYPNGDEFGGIWCAFEDDAHNMNRWEEEMWQNVREAYDDVLIIDCLDLYEHDLNLWSYGGFTFSPKVLRLDSPNHYNYAAFKPSTVIQSSTCDKNMIPDPSGGRDHIKEIWFSAFNFELKHFILTIRLYGDCRPYTYEFDDYRRAEALEAVTVIFVHQGPSEHPPIANRPSADGAGMLSGLIDAAAGYYRTTKFTFVGLVEHAIQLGIVDAPTNATEMHTHLVGRIAAGKVRLGINADSNRARASIPEDELQTTPDIHLLSNDEYRAKVGDYMYELETFRDRFKD